LTPVKLPEDLIPQPIHCLRGLKPGESAWIDWLDMIVDPDRSCFLNPDAKIYEKQSVLTIRATCTEAGFEVLIPIHHRTPFRWTPGEFPVREGYFPVVKLERAADEAPNSDFAP
jgi:hypothetical protein